MASEQQTVWVVLQECDGYGGGGYVMAVFSTEDAAKAWAIEHHPRYEFQRSTKIPGEYDWDISIDAFTVDAPRD